VDVSPEPSGVIKDPYLIMSSVQHDHLIPLCVLCFMRRTDIQAFDVHCDPRPLLKLEGTWNQRMKVCGHTSVVHLRSLLAPRALILYAAAILCSLMTMIQV
jgi:hypothetical protein